MLFVISTNDQTKNNIVAGTATGSLEDINNESSVNAEDELNKLVERVDSTDKIIVSDEINALSADGKTQELTDEKKGFFSFLRRGDKEDKKQIESTNQEIAESEEQETEASNREVENIEEKEENKAKEEAVEEKTETVEEVNSDEDSENIEENGDTETAENTSLFDKLFGKKEIVEEDELSDENKNQEIDTSSENSETTETKNTEEKSSDFQVTTKTVVESKVQNIGGNMSKNSGTQTMLVNASSAYMHQYPQEVQDTDSEMKYPGLNLKTAIGKEFEVGVHMLKLNNANFSVKLALMNHGDRLKQLTKENSYGCFLIEILDAQNKINVWKKWYVCKKYLQEASQVVKVKTITPKILPAVQEETEQKSETIIDQKVDQISNSQSESFLPEEPQVIEKRIIETQDISSQNDTNTEALEKNSQKSFLPEEPVFIEKRFVPNESFLPEETSIQ